MEAPLSPSEAAGQLGIGRSQVHRLLQSGALRGQRLGRSWMVDAESVRQRRAVHPGRGRPVAAAVAWKLLLDADVLDVEDLPALAVMARRRSFVQHARVLPSELAALEADGLAVLSGAAGAVALGAAASVRDDRDIYVRSSDWDAVAEAHAIRAASADANLVVRIVADEAWPFADGRHVAPLVVCALDSFERLDLRSAHEALAAQDRSGG